mmetsp:Transcript_27919/g.45428  ORF Transcript_27919/g.45428 Transcript_27919/m.45428 type:complete len:141 (-) Transcript_27919:1656-2078(-)
MSGRPVPPLKTGVILDTEGKVLPSPDAANILMSLKFPSNKNGKKANSNGVKKEGGILVDQQKNKVIKPPVPRQVCSRIKGISKESFQREEQRLQVLSDKERNSGKMRKPAQQDGKARVRDYNASNGGLVHPIQQQQQQQQ